MFDHFGLCLGQSWTLTDGRLSLADSLTVFLLYGCALVGFIAVRHQGRAIGRGFWAALIFLCLAIALTKHNALPQVLTGMMRCEERLGGWYLERRSLQGLALVWLQLGLVVLIVALAFGLRGRFWINALAAGGVVAMIGTGLLRTVSLHQIDALLRLPAGGMTVDSLLQLLGPLLVLANAVLHSLRLRPCRRRRRRRRHGSRGRPHATGRAPVEDAPYDAQPTA